MISVQHVSKTYPLGQTQVTALRDVELEISKGESVAIAGPSGSGKSTLLSLIGCLEQPSDGKIFLEGADVSLLTRDEAAELRSCKIGFIFQTFNLLSVLTAYENVEYPLHLQNVPDAERRRRVTDLLREVGLESHARHQPSQLSGGQRQRVAIARALAISPVLLLADEPTANLDAETGMEIVALLNDLNRKSGVTLVISTHDPRIIGQMRRTVYLSGGRVAAGKP